MKKLFHSILQNKTSQGYLLIRFFSFPFWGIFNLLPIILIKDLHASAFQIATVIALKPITAIFSSYWSSIIQSKKNQIISYLFWTNVIKYIPFLFFPFLVSPWFYIFSFGIYMAFLRGTIPAWMEILKRNLPCSKVGKICSLGLAIEYLGTSLLPFFFGWILDNFSHSWKLLFPITAIIGIFSSFFICMIPSINKEYLISSIEEKISLKNVLFKPWRNSWNLLSQRRDFLKFQIGFFLGGAGLIIMQTAVPKYFVENLHLSYTSVLIAIATFKGIGFVFSSPLWVKFFHKTKIFSFCSYVTLFAALFPFFLFLANFHQSFVYLGYLFYGIMQGGSELSWKMSGPNFSKNADSSPFTLINIGAVGIRGIIFPYFGYLLYVASNTYIVLLIGSIFCILTTFYMRNNDKKYSPSTSSIN